MGEHGFCDGQPQGDEGEIFPEFGADAFLLEGVGEAGATCPVGDISDFAEFFDLRLGEFIEA